MRTPLTFLGGLLIALPLILLLEYFASWSAAFVFDEYLVYIVVGTLMLLGARAQNLSATKANFARFLGILLIALAGWYLVGDFLLPRQSCRAPHRTNTPKLLATTGLHRLPRQYSRPGLSDYSEYLRSN